MKKERNVGIDLLRIISMVLVVLLHVLGQGGILNNCMLFSANYQLAWFLEVLAYCSVNCYALISGYVGLDSKFKYSNIVYLWLKVIFYTIFITGIFFIIFPQTISLNNILKAMFPVLFNQYWYFTSYFCMFFFIPFFNILLTKLSKKNTRNLILTIVVFFSIIAMLSPTDIFALSSGYSVLWLSVLYLIGGYIKKYNMFKNWNIKKLFFGFIFCVVFTWSSKLFIEAITLEIFGRIRGNMFLIRYNSITVLFQAIFLLLMFSRLKIKHGNKIIGYVSPLSFSVYIIHTHPLIWYYLMKDRFSSFSYSPFFKLLLLIVVSVIVIYVVCTIIDIIREKIFNLLKVKRFSNYIVDKVSNIKLIKNYNKV